MRLRPAASMVLALALASPAMAEVTLDSTMQALAARRQSAAAFSEQKSIPELSTPLPSTGTLSWTAPDRLEKHTTWPAEETLRIDGDRLLLERPSQNIRQELSLDQSPELRPFVEAIRGTLAGDLRALRQYYEVAFSAEGDGWHMTLVPLSARIKVALQSIDIFGKESAVTLVETRGNDGTTRLRITPRP